MHISFAFSVFLFLCCVASLWLYVNADRLGQFRAIAFLSRPPSAGTQSVARTRRLFAAGCVLLLVMSVGLALSDRYRAATNARLMEQQLLTQVGPSIRAAYQQFTADGIPVDDVLIAPALTTASGLREERALLAQHAQRVERWTQALAELDVREEAVLDAMPGDERSKAMVRDSVSHEKRGRKEQMRDVRMAHLELINAIASVHQFMESRLGHTSSQGDTLLFETDEDIREFQRLMARVEAARTGVTKASDEHDRVTQLNPGKDSADSSAHEGGSQQ
jgi:hypothetical protein